MSERRSKWPKKTYSNADMAAMIGRNIDALGRRMAADGDPADLAAFRSLQQRMDATLEEVVGAMREQGVTDGEIASGLGVSRQAVSKRWPARGRYVGAAGRYRRSTDGAEAEAEEGCDAGP